MYGDGTSLDDPDDGRSAFMLARTLERMSQCDVVVFEAGWKRDFKTRMMHEVAWYYEYRILEL